MNLRASIALIASALFAEVAGAQSPQAVEWKVSEGGNGHWYKLETEGRTWMAAEAFAESIGGHLATATSDAENLFVFAVSGGQGNTWIGGRQAPGACEPGCGWSWITGEPWVFTAWQTSSPQPDNTGGNENHLAYWGIEGGVARWNDGNEQSVARFTIEWDTDCNGDGIVDYGQIVRGELADLNGNGVPDICETSISSVIPPSVPAQGGSAITIRGNGFPQNPVVLIGGVPTTNVVRVSAAQITATTPALLPGMASVSVSGFTLAEGVYIRPECGSDLDQDGEVTASDIAIVLLDFGPCYATATSSQPADSTPFLLKEEPVSGTAAPR